MSSLQFHLHLSPPSSRELIYFKGPNPFLFSKRHVSVRRLNGLFTSKFTNFVKASSSSSGAAIEKSVVKESGIGRPFDINLAVILAGFAFEAYSTPPENVGNREIDAAKCQLVFLSQNFLREVYDGQLFVKLKKGYDFPAMDPWGTSDPYVILQLDSQVVKSNIKWGTKEPNWNEDFTLNIKQSHMKDLQVAAWDANLVTPHKRMGNASIDLGNLCDGDAHEVLVELEGMGGGGKIVLEIKYKSFSKIDDEKVWWKIPIVTNFLQKHGFEPALKMILGSETIEAHEFAKFAFARLKSLNDSYLRGDWLLSDNSSEDTKTSMKDNQEEEKIEKVEVKAGTDSDAVETLQDQQVEDGSSSQKQFWKMLADSVNLNVVQKLGMPVPENIKWDGFEVLKNIGLQSLEKAEALYIESGLATPNNQEVADVDTNGRSDTMSTNQASLPDIKTLTQDILRQTDSILGGLMVFNAAASKLKEGAISFGRSENDTSGKTEVSSEAQDGIPKSGPSDIILGEKEAEEVRALFSTAESAMEAWAMLANSLGHSSLIKSEFEKICFLDNAETDTQVAVWRDTKGKRLVIAFRGTEQSRWKDLMTDLMLVPAGLNPERIGGDFKEEIQVHSGFLKAYDSIRTRLISLIKQATDHSNEVSEQLPLPKWHIFVTGHSLGGALATLLALELSSSQLAKQGAITVTMYNFGSPRVGNRRFAELYNEEVKDSWRIVNQRDIIPTVPRLMGYCHVAQPVYLAAVDLRYTRDTLDLLEDGYQGDVIGEATPDILVNEFMRGEKELMENILNTEISIFRAIRDGSALMQHMEDFYYITLLESVRSNHQMARRPPTS